MERTAHLKSTRRSDPLGRALLVAAMAISAGGVSPLAPAAPPAPLTSERSATLQDILAAAEKQVVAIAVEREEGSDLRRPRLSRRLRRGEARAYFERPEGLVSGLLVDAAGHVLTSGYNIVGKLKSLHVILYTGHRYEAKVIATSGPDDLALLRIALQETDPPIPDHPVRWNEDRLRAGQIVFALGRSPDASRVTATRGIISAVSRNGGRAIQTDASLNYGNAGGPLIDLEGRVVAVACHVGHHQPQWGINSGVGFGTTAGTLRSILPELTSGHDVRWGDKPFLGVEWNDKAFEERGAEIRRVQPGSAAESAGLKSGDRLLEIDGTRIASFPHLRRLIFLKKPHQKIRLKVERETENRREQLEIEATLGVRDER